MVDLPWNAMSFVVGRQALHGGLPRPAGKPEGGALQRAQLRAVRLLLRRRMQRQEAADGGVPSVATGRGDDQGGRRGTERGLRETANRDGEMTQ